MVLKVNFRVSLMVCFFLCLALGSEAKVRLPKLVSNGMVLQRNQPVNVWGGAEPGETVKINFLKKNYETVADANGNWQMTLPATKPGGPFILIINDIQLKDILVGDVFLCAGQSNMELPVSRTLDLFRAEAEADSNPMIRHIRIPIIYNFHAPQSEMGDTGWKELNPQNALSFTAVGYFFAKDLFARTNVPVGLINTAVGGTPVEAWISEEGLQEFPKYLNEKRLYESDKLIADTRKLEGERQYIWNTVLYRGDAGLHESTPWYAANYDDRSWATVDMFPEGWKTRGLRPAAWATDGVNPKAGSHWFRKNIEITQEQAGKQAILRLGCMVDADSVYVNGTFVGTTAYMYPPRIYTVPAGLLKAGKNTVTVRIISYGGTPSFVPDKPYKLIIGPEEINLEGQWKYRQGCPMVAGGGQTFFQYKPEGLYNGMIAPCTPYTLAGALWYQGESNATRHNEYAALLTGMMKDWRTKFKQPELPFYIIELALFMHASDTRGQAEWAALRAQQAKAATENSNATLIRNSDLGEWNDIHPVDKKTVGQRVAEAVWANINKK